MKLKLAAAAAALAVMTAPAYAGEWEIHSYADFMASPDTQAVLGDFPISFGETASGTSIGRTNSGRPAKSFHTPHDVACQRALLNALKGMMDKTLASGGTRLTGVHSTNGLVKDKSTEYACNVSHFKALAPVVGQMTK